MPGLHNTFGIAARNFTAHPEMPDARALVEYGVKMEEMGFDSLWVWDHILLGVEPSFPIIDSLALLTAIAARTKRIKLSTGIAMITEWKWNTEALRRYVDHALDCFGPDRCMAASNWPVIELAASYEQAWGGLTELVSGLDAKGRAAALGGTAERVDKIK